MPTLALTRPPVAADSPDILDDPLQWQPQARWVSGSDGSRLAESAFQLGGLHCAACSGIIEAALMTVPGVHQAQVSAAAQRATVSWDPQRTRPSALIEAVQAAGYSAVPDAAAPARALRKHLRRQALWRLFVATFCAMQVMMLATPSYVADVGELDAGLRQLLNWASWTLTLPVLAFSATEFFSSAWRSIRARRIGMDVPVALGITITFLASTAATFSPQGLLGHEVYFDSLTMFVSFLLAGRYLELAARQRAEQALEDQVGILPETALRLGADGSQQTVSVHRLAPGDLVRVPTGQGFPADGQLEQGHTSADESLLTGESVPVPKRTGDGVIAGSLNLGAPVLMRVQRVGADTRLQTIVSMMHSAAAQRPAQARLADRWAGPFLWAVMALAAGAAVAWGVLVDPAKAVWVAVSVLIVTCPCALSLAGPATLVAAARGLARRGVLLQRLDALEPLAAAQQVFLDKTGTLTDAQVALREVLPAQAQRMDAALALQTAGSLAGWSSHPLSRALQQAAGDAAPVGPEFHWHDVQEHAGLGLSARDNAGQHWRLGVPAWAQSRAQTQTQTHDVETSQRAALACDGEVLAHFEFDEALRPGTAQAVRALQQSGATVTLLSGDSPERAQALAHRLVQPSAQRPTPATPMTVLAHATPGEKRAALAQAQALGHTTLMVGDGINDGPVLAQADVSMAMGQGALVARSRADAVITSNDLRDLVRARATAQKAMTIVRQNLTWAAAYNAVCIPLALLGMLPPWAAGLGMACSSLVVVLNAQRAAT